MGFSMTTGNIGGRLGPPPPKKLENLSDIE